MPSEEGSEKCKSELRVGRLGCAEYAILVGVLVVIAILAIVAFRERVAELWNAISDGINSL